MAAISVRHEGQGTVRSGEDKNRRLIRYWLYAVFVVLIAIVMVGGATRMTGSGLSITEWKPIHGVIPPLNHAEWLEEFDKYRQIPQYQQINKGMSLEAFQSIFWWEWAHRMLARFVGFLVAIPLAFFWLTGRLNSSLKYRMLGLLALGGGDPGRPAAGVLPAPQDQAPAGFHRGAVLARAGRSRRPCRPRHRPLHRPADDHGGRCAA